MADNVCYRWVIVGLFDMRVFTARMKGVLFKVTYWLLPTQICSEFPTKVQSTP